MGNAAIDKTNACKISNVSGIGANQYKGEMAKSIGLKCTPKKLPDGLMNSSAVKYRNLFPYAVVQRA